MNSDTISETFLMFKKCVSNRSFDFNFRYFVTKCLKSVFVCRINILKLGIDLHTKTAVDSNNNKLSFVHSCSLPRPSATCAIQLQITVFRLKKEIIQLNLFSSLIPITMLNLCILHIIPIGG